MRPVTLAAREMTSLRRAVRPEWVQVRESFRKWGAGLCLFEAT